MALIYKALLPHKRWSYLLNGVKLKFVYILWYLWEMIIVISLHTVSVAWGYFKVCFAQHLELLSSTNLTFKDIILSFRLQPSNKTGDL